ncbi:hypothetical protein LTS18_011235 [Coniosporium uncinatum]|uniref:Uncharacterized protein n=1 Tax=Coniosporium uncinatum TaxID=93489 RepID=A0ACC3DKJ4_9PEZI|nr:hypothetical protein LTS18_011235 [Coniosporium uncinatum]
MGLRHEPVLLVPAQLLPCAINGAVAASALPFLLPRVPIWAILATAMFFFSLTMLLLAVTPVDQTYWAMTFPTTLLASIGPELSFTSASIIVSNQVRGEHQGAAGSFVNTVVNYSVGMGLAFAANLEKAVNSDGSQTLKGYKAAWWLGMAFAAVGVVLTVLFRKRM